MIKSTHTYSAKTTFTNDCVHVSSELSRLRNEIEYNIMKDKRDNNTKIKEIKLEIIIEDE